MKKVFIIFSIASLLMSCSKSNEAIACFQLDKTTFDVDESITFKNCSYSNFRNTWSFGDGSSSLDSFPTHKYTQPGTYIVTLRSTSEGGVSTNAISQTINVQEGYNKFFPYLSGELTISVTGNAPVTINSNLSFNTSVINPNKIYFNPFGLSLKYKRIIGVVNLNEVTFASVEDSLAGNTLGPNATAVFKDATWKLNPDTKVLDVAYSIEIKNAATTSNNKTTRYTFKSTAQ